MAKERVNHFLLLHQSLRESNKAKEIPAAQSHHALSVLFLRQVANDDIVIVWRESFVSHQRIILDVVLRDRAADLYWSYIFFLIELLFTFLKNAIEEVDRGDTTFGIKVHTYCSKLLIGAEMQALYQTLLVHKLLFNVHLLHDCPTGH